MTRAGKTFWDPAQTKYKQHRQNKKKQRGKQ